MEGFILWFQLSFSSSLSVSLQLLLSIGVFQSCCWGCMGQAVRQVGIREALNNAQVIYKTREPNY